MNGLTNLEILALEDPASDRTLIAAAKELLERVTDTDLVEHEIEYLGEVVAKIDEGEV